MTFVLLEDEGESYTSATITEEGDEEMEELMEEFHVQVELVHEALPCLMVQEDNAMVATLGQ